MELSVLRMKLQRAEDKLAKANSLREEKGPKPEEKSLTVPSAPALSPKASESQPESDVDAAMKYWAERVEEARGTEEKLRNAVAYYQKEVSYRLKD